MSESRNKTVEVIWKLVLISVVSAVLLGITYVPTHDQLKINYEEARTVTLADIMPQADSFEAVYGDTIINEDGDREVLYYRAKDASGNLIGYAFFCEQPGAQGNIDIAGGVDSSFRIIKGMDVMRHSETPGLGAKITEPWFRDQFSNVELEKLSLSKDGGAIDSITGATISSQAVVDALNKQVSVVQEAEAQKR